MSIKNKSRSLYFTMPGRVVLALLVSIGLFAILAFSADFILLNILDINNEEQKQQTDQLVAEIQLRIAEQNLSFAQAQDIADLWSNYGYTLHFLSSSEQYTTTDNASAINDTYFIYPIKFAASDGSLLLISNFIRHSYMTYFSLATIGSLALFLILILKEISKLIAKIKTIEQGISIIAHDDLQHKIELQAEKELSDLAQNINAMGETIYQKNSQEQQEEINKRAFITNLAHDIRTPLTSISGYLELILSQSQGQDELNNYAHIAQKNTTRLKKLIEDLFLYSKLISHDLPLDLQTYNLNTILRQVCELRESEFKLHIDSKPLMIEVDLNHFQRAIGNLIDNAEKYKSAAADIIISSYIEENQAIISIANKTDDDLSAKIHLLSQRMYKAEESRSDNSSGLGLSIVIELLKTFDADLSLAFEQQIFTAKVLIPLK